MPKYNKIETGIRDLYIIEPTVHGDNSGFFMETYTKRDFEEIGINYEFVQDNHSKSKKGVLRGMHFQTQHAQDKLIRVIKGKVYDAVIDMREGSPTFGKYFGVELSEENKRMFMIPKGFAHGFLSLTEEVEFLYKVTDYYYPGYDSGVIWNDAEVGVAWPFEEYGIAEPLLSDKDKTLKPLKDAKITYKY